MALKVNAAIGLILSDDFIDARAFLKLRRKRARSPDVSPLRRQAMSHVFSFAGMTLLELLVAMAIAGALLALGVPSFGGFLAEQQLQDRADSLVHALDRARSEAIKRGARVHVCPDTGQDCPGAAAAWESGWNTVVTTGEGTSVAIAREPRAPDGITIRGNRPVADYVSYTPLGNARRTDGALQMGTFTLCRHGHKVRKVILASSGRARIERTTETCP